MKIAFFGCVITSVTLWCAANNNPAPSAVAPSDSASLTPSPARISTSDDQGFIMPQTGNYIYANNVWGKGSITGYTNTLWFETESNWGFEYRWPKGSGNIKSYPSAICGWHFGKWSQYSGLPVQVSAGKDILTDWQFECHSTGSWDTAYDLFFHDCDLKRGSNRPPHSDIKAELMIWLNHTPDMGNKHIVARDVTLGGRVWDVIYFRNKIHYREWDYYAFLLKPQTMTGITLNIKDLTDYMQTNSVTPQLSSNWWVSCVDVGTESNFGTGRLRTMKYTVAVQ